MVKEFKNAQEAFEYYYDEILKNGKEYNGCKTLFNQGFYIQNPLDNKILTPWRKWKFGYAEAEWDWYLSGDPSVKEIGKRAKIWLQIADDFGNVNSNYGYQWKRGNQLGNIIQHIKENKETRKASISLYDGKEYYLYNKDTVCTYAISFTPKNGKLDMTVMMRSNDLWLGFGNDQYCFSKLLEHVCEKTNLEVGEYYHFAVNLHLYPRHYDNKNRWENKHGKYKLKR